MRCIFSTRLLRRRTLSALPETCVAAVVGAILLAATPMLAEHTRWWPQTTFEDFDKGTARGVAVSSDGKLFLAPRFAEFADAGLAYVLSLRADAAGNLYAAGGSNAKVLRYAPNGKTSTVFESPELAAQALALDRAGNLYVGTSPDGKVYKITPDGKSSMFFDPKSKYIWDLMVDRDGHLYVATGDAGNIFVVAPDGRGQIFYSSEETHVRTLALDANENVLAGTEPSGLVLRIPKMMPLGDNSAPQARRAFVLYETSKKEITALLPDASGNLYVSAVGEKTAPTRAPPRTPTSETTVSGNFGITINATGQAGTLSPSPGQTPGTPFIPFQPLNSSSVYRIASDGSPEELWSSRDDLVYTLGLLPNGKLLLGTGNQGTVLELERGHIYSRLVRTAAAQVTSIALGPAGQLFLATGNPGKIFTIGPASEPEGSFESQPFDARIFSRWGHLEWRGRNRASQADAGKASIEFFARSGNTSDPNNNWSRWEGPYSSASGDKIDSPAGRFIQWKAVLHANADGVVPEVTWVNVAYLPKNIAPEITAVALQNPGIRAQGISMPNPGTGSQTSAQLRLPQPAGTASPFNSVFSPAGTGLATASTAPRFDSIPQGVTQKGYQSVLWAAEDANDDPLEFAVYYRGENETNWNLLKDKLETRFYSWDTTTMADGAYYLKIVASDSPSNPAGEALTAERETERFEVDNTPPAITDLTAQVRQVSGRSLREPLKDARARATVQVRFQASHPSSSIARAQYSLDAGEWTLVFPTGGLSDSPRESYDFELPAVLPGEHTVTVRVFDQFENVATAKATLHVASSGN